MILSGPVYKPRSGGKAKSAIIMLHGVGADGENLIGIAPFMSALFPDTVFLSPNAPYEFDMYPSGYQWFSLADRDPEVMLAGARNVEPVLNQYIDEVMAEYELPATKVALLGFSQGTMVSLFAALRRSDKIAGIAGFSGALLSPELLPAEVKSKPDICLIHGELDDVVPFAALAKAEYALKQNGFNVEAHSRPGLPHSIDPEGIEIAAHFLKNRLYQL